MTFGQLGVAALVGYLALLLVVAEVARRSKSDDSPSDHFLAGRGLGTFVLFLTLYATAYSGNSLLGYPGRAYTRGVSFIMATGFMMSIIVVFHALAPKLRAAASANGFVTPGDWIRHRFPATAENGVNGQVFRPGLGDEARRNLGRSAAEPVQLDAGVAFEGGSHFFP